MGPKFKITVKAISHHSNCKDHNRVILVLYKLKWFLGMEECYITCKGWTTGLCSALCICLCVIVHTVHKPPFQQLHAILITTSASYSRGVKKEMNLSRKGVSDDSVQPLDFRGELYISIVEFKRIRGPNNP